MADDPLKNIPFGGPAISAPNKMPTGTIADQGQFAESDARLIATLEAGEEDRQAEYIHRRSAQRRERFALSVFKILIGREEGSKLTDYRAMACESVEAADALAEMLDHDPAKAILPAYTP